jgi:hypothetical protein
MKWVDPRLKIRGSVQNIPLIRSSAQNLSLIWSSVKICFWYKVPNKTYHLWKLTGPCNKWWPRHCLMTKNWLNIALNICRYAVHLQKWSKGQSHTFINQLFKPTYRTRFTPKSNFAHCYLHISEILKNLLSFSCKQSARASRTKYCHLLQLRRNIYLAINLILDMHTATARCKNLF